MYFDITTAPFGMRPMVNKPNPEFLTEITESGMRELISQHYEGLKVSSIASMFPTDEKALADAKKHAADFFIQICGGPAYFNTSRGAPRMAGRHQPFAIDMDARLVWLELYIPLLKEQKEKGVSEASIQSFWNYLDIFSLWMVNTK